MGQRGGKAQVERVYGLLEEARKCWDYVISDEMVYGSEFCDPHLEPATDAAVRFAEYNLGRLCIELKFKLVRQGNFYFHCVLEAALPQLRRAMNREPTSGRIHRHHEVLVRNAQLIQNPEGASVVT